MLYITDTSQWSPETLEEACAQHGILVIRGLESVAAMSLASKLIKEHIQQYYGASGIKINERGRPALMDVDADFNLSHHNGWVVAIAARAPPMALGIDIADAQVDIFDSAELAELFTVPPKNSQETAIFWAAREAFLKHTGEGVRNAPVRVALPSHLSLPDLSKDPGFVTMPLIKVDSQYARLFRLGPNTVGAAIAPASAISELKHLDPLTGYAMAQPTMASVPPLELRVTE